MIKIKKEVEKLMTERFGKDNIITIATVKDNVPFARYVDAYYENGSFYIITHALSNKMKHIKINPSVAIAGEWFSAQGIGINLGYVGKKENTEIVEKLKKVFSEWIDNGHTDFNDKNTIILRVELTKWILLSNGNRYKF